VRKITLKLKHVGGVYQRNGDCLLCHDALGELFTLPKVRSTPITFIISDKETKNSYKVRFGKPNDCDVFYEGEWHYKCLFGDADIFISRHALNGATCWVNLYWEE